ncbi:hypothetical protein FRC09_012898, partial [Ceratobasidium sp. 395]
MDASRWRAGPKCGHSARQDESKARVSRIVPNNRTQAMRLEREGRRYEAREARPYRVPTSQVLGESGGQDPINRGGQARRFESSCSSARLHAWPQPWDYQASPGAWRRGEIAWLDWCDSARVQNALDGFEATRST